jgi:WD40 repeat protein
LSEHVGAIPSVAISGDGERLVRATGREVRIWNNALGGEEWTLRGHGDLVYSVAISPDGKHVVTGSFDRSVKVWDVASRREERTLLGHTGSIYGVAIRSDGQLVVSASEDRTVKLWDVQTGHERMTLRGHTDSVTSVAISADGKHLVSASRDGTVKVWNVEKCLPPLTAEMAGGRSVQNTAAQANGRVVRW